MRLMETVGEEVSPAEEVPPEIATQELPLVMIVIPMGVLLLTNAIPTVLRLPLPARWVVTQLRAARVVVRRRASTSRAIPLVVATQPSRRARYA